MAGTVLVTGGAGYIGSHTCRRLAECGFRPVVYDNLSRGHSDFVRWGPLEVGDIRDVDALDKVVRRHRPILVLHFAALAYVAESFAEPTRYYNVNVGGLGNLLQCMHRHRCAKLVFSSSCATYGVPGVARIVETDPQRPISPYGWSKLMGERIIADAACVQGLQWMALRYFNAAGASLDLELGEWHEPEPHVIPRLIASSLSETNDAFELYGDDYPTEDGSAVRDYVHVEDLADAHVRAAQYLLADGTSAAVNLGAERGVSVKTLIAEIERITGRAITVRTCQRREGDPPFAVADGTLASELLGWRPRHTAIRSILDSAIRWQQGPGLRLAQSPSRNTLI